MRIVGVRRAGLPALVLGLVCGGIGTTDAAQSAASGSGPLAGGAELPEPAAPAVITRDAEGRATIRAIRLAEPLRIDGRLDESLYDSPSVSDFIQVEPQGGRPATEKTEVWVSFDSDNVYVSFRNWESQAGRLIANEMRRDNTNITMGNDNIAFLFDTFLDRRNAMLFETNPLGGRMDGQVANERPSMDFNPVWNVKAGRFDGGWTVEAAVPFKSLRYGPEQRQRWGFNARRVNRSKNEVSFITRLSNARGIQATFQIAQAATLVGIEAPPSSRNLEIKPYVTGNTATNRATGVSNDASGEVGVDVKYAVTRNVSADVTYNTDFAQVEADEQQVNLTRFNLFFPEKREFFLENQGTFAFGGVAANGNAAGDTPILFYSRRIGLDRGQSVPIEAGGRLTGRVGRYTLGVLNIQTDQGPDIPGRTGLLAGQRSTNFSVLRIRRDILRRSNVGVILTDRSIGQARTGRNTAYGADATLGFFTNMFVNAYWARTQTTGVVLPAADTSWRTQLDYGGDRYGVQIERLRVDGGFNPEVGFARRTDIRKSFGQFRFSPRPRRNGVVRKYQSSVTVNYLENAAGRVEWRDRIAEGGVDFQNSDVLRVSVVDNYEFLPAPFAIATRVTVPVGGYGSRTARASFQMGQQRRLSATVSAERGTFYSGHKTTVGVSRGRVNLSPQFSVEPSYSINLVDLREGAFTTHLAGSRITYTLTPRMFASALIQYNSGTHAVASNARLRWEYQPGSELFVVYNEDRGTPGAALRGLSTRSFIVKINRLLRP